MFDTSGDVVAVAVKLGILPVPLLSAKPVAVLSLPVVLVCYAAPPEALL